MNSRKIKTNDKRIQGRLAAVALLIVTALRGLHT